MVRRFLYSLAFIFFCSSGYCLNGPDGETLVPTLNPFTGNLQLITEISTNTIIPGTGITITTAPGSITINTNVGGGPGLASTQTWTGINTFGNNIISSQTVTSENVSFSTITNLTAGVINSTNPIQTGGFNLGESYYTNFTFGQWAPTSVSQPIGLTGNAITLSSSGTYQLSGYCRVDIVGANTYMASATTYTFNLAETVNFKTNITNASWSACPGASPSNQYGSYLYTYWTPFIPFAIYTTTTTSDVIKMQASYSGGGPSGGGIFVMTGWIGALRVK